MVTDAQGNPTEYRFEEVGGALCLDFTNTIGRGVTTANEHLLEYGDLVRWAHQVGLLEPPQAERLRAAASRSAPAANEALARARELRETIYRIFAAEVRGESPGSADLEALNAALQEAMARCRVTQAGDTYAWGWEDNEELDRMLWPVLRSAADLLTSSERERIKECGSDTCEWLFLDTSKNRRRRWCDMRSCGNLAKVRRHRARKKTDS